MKKISEIDKIWNDTLSEIDKIWNDTPGVNKDTISTHGVITEREALALSEKEIEGKQNNRIGLEYKVMYLPVVVGVDRYDEIQDVSTVLISSLLGKEYIK